MLRTVELDYDLPPGLIATRPAEPRDSARMLVLWRSDPTRPIEHRAVRDLSEYLHAGDALVFNNTAVVPARFMGRRVETGGHIEGLFLEIVPTQDARVSWRVLLKSGGRLHPGDHIELSDHDGHPAGPSLELATNEDGEWIVQLEGDQSTLATLDLVGWTPLPPYILKARGDHLLDDQEDRRWYQTVFADRAQGQSVAAPTAGLHFTPGLLDQFKAKGVQRIDITLHVGAGTFKPVVTETIEQHPMHFERIEVQAMAMRDLRLMLQRRQSGQTGRLLAVGTTSVRTLESLSPEMLANSMANDPVVRATTNLLISPPYEFKVVQGMLTNFHLPRSTLLALVAAMIGLDRVKSAYREAIDRRYRFYSYGDAMLILP